VALDARERESEIVIAQHSEAVIPRAPAEISVRARPPLSSRPDPDQPSAEPTQVEREKKMFAWLLLLLKEHRPRAPARPLPTFSGAPSKSPGRPRDRARRPW
jgi:hypothetical protein